MRLAAELYGTIIGTLEGDARSFDFLPTAAGIDHFGTNSPVLSITMPLTPKQRRDRAGRRRNWFSELLPEGDQYDYMLVQGGIRRDDTPAFLSRYGRDVAGALQIWDIEDPKQPEQSALKPVNISEVRELLQDPIRSPLANEEEMGKSSLGGVQPKIVLVRTGQNWAQSLGGYPTTHILKGQLDGENATVIFDEEYGSRIARKLGLAEFETWIDDFDGLPALVIERYDRRDGARIHQEDFSQALGASRNEKYQELGGVVSLQRVAESLKRHAADSDLRELARMVILAVAIGNLDMHTKNIGLLHPATGEVRLAPAYDVVPQAHRRNDGRLALAINRKYRHEEITRDDLIAEFAMWRLRRRVDMIDQTLEELAGVIEQETPRAGAFPQLQEQISTFVDNLRQGRPAGGG